MDQRAVMVGAVAAAGAVQAIATMAPFWFGKLAVLALEDRHVAIGPEARAALATTSTAGHYRAAARTRELDLTRLPLPRRLDMQDTVMYFRLEDGLAATRSPIQLWDRRRTPYVNLRVEVFDAGSCLVLRSRVVPPNLILGLIAWSLALATIGRDVQITAALVGFGLFGMGLSWLFGRPRAEQAANDLRDSVALAVRCVESDAESKHVVR